MRRLLVAVRAWAAANWEEILAQIGHFLGGYAAVLTGEVLWHSPWFGLLGMECWAIPKEFYVDPKVESAPVRGSGVRDLILYHAGAALGFYVVYRGRR